MFPRVSPITLEVELIRLSRGYGDDLSKGYQYNCHGRLSKTNPSFHAVRNVWHRIATYMVRRFIRCGISLYFSQDKEFLKFNNKG